MVRKKSIPTFFVQVSTVCRACLNLTHLGIYLFGCDEFGLDLFEQDIGGSIRHLCLDRRYTAMDPISTDQ